LRRRVSIKAVGLRGPDASALIDEQQIGLEGCSQCYCSGFSFVKSCVVDRCKALCSDDLNQAGGAAIQR
jgi:hypothetical protein